MEISWSEQEKKVQERIKTKVNEIDIKAKSCTTRSSNELRNSAVKVLGGHRSGRRYKKPYTRNAYYTASAPGEPPAVRTGILRMSWKPKGESNGKGKYTACIESDVPYAEILEERSKNPRPYKDKIIEDAKPKVIQIFSQLK